jgi:hypothetical protein
VRCARRGVMPAPQRQTRGDAPTGRSARTPPVGNDNDCSREVKHPDEYAIHAYPTNGAGRQPDGKAHRHAWVRGLRRRILTLIAAAVVLYGVAPAVLEVLGAYRRLTDVDPAWWIAVVAMSAAGIWCMCAVQRLALNARAGSRLSRRSLPEPRSARSSPAGRQQPPRYRPACSPRRVWRRPRSPPDSRQARCCSSSRWPACRCWPSPRWRSAAGYPMG